MNNADKFKQIFDLYATELWAMSEKDFLAWLNAESDVPDRKVGKWITEYDIWGGLFKTVRAHKCSICGHYLDFDGVNAGSGDANYCPHCGAKMERSEDATD